jgi:hypothetical protein
MTMNKSEALAIDKRYKMLPGGQGEHEFWVQDSRGKVAADLNRFAEQCGGYYEFGNPGVLHTCNCGVFLIHFAADRSRVAKIEQLFAPNRLVLYWDERRERNVGDYYQGRNGSAPFLSDWELSHPELVEDEARECREHDETPPPKPKPIDHDNQKP